MSEMGTYLFRGKYSSEAFQVMISSPTHRGNEAKDFLEKSGGTVIGVYYAISRCELVGIVECTPRQVTAIEMACMATNAFVSIEVEAWVSPDLMFASMDDASKISGNYNAPNRDEIDRMLLE